MKAQKNKLSIHADVSVFISLYEEQTSFHRRVNVNVLSVEGVVLSVLV